MEQNVTQAIINANGAWLEDLNINFKIQIIPLWEGKNFFYWIE